MVLSLTATGIQSEAADTGTYTWADVVALNSPFMTTHIQTSGRPLYRWTGVILIQGSAILNIELITLELLGTSSGNPGIIQARGTANVNFGRKRTINSKPFYDRSCQLIVTRTRYLNAGAATAANDVATAPLSCLLSGASAINIYASEVLISNPGNITDATKRVPLIVKALENTVVTNESIAVGSALCILAVGGSARNDGMFGIALEAPTPTGIAVAKNDLYDSRLSVYNESATTRLEVSDFEQNLETVTIPTAAFFTNGVDYLNSPTYSLAQQQVFKNGTGTPQEHRKTYSHDLRIKRGNANVENALVVYSGRTSASFTSASTGLVSQFKLVAEETNLAGYSPQPNNFATYARPIPLIDYSAYTRQIRSYLDEAVLDPITVDSQVGSSTLPFSLALTLDAGITQVIQATAAAVTGISHTATTVTVSASRSLAEIYDSRKAYWRDNGGTTAKRIGVLADFINLNITIGAGAAITASTAKFLDGLQTSGIITLTDARAYNGVPFSVVGGFVNVATENTDLRTWAFDNTTINVSSPTGTAVVTVAADQLSKVIAGARVTVQSPLVFVSAPNFAQNTRVQVARLEPYSVPSTAIDVTTNMITIAGNRFKSAAPASFVYFQLQPGATIPTTSPQIANNTLYFVQAAGVPDGLTAGQFRLSLTQNGAAIDFLDQGAGNFSLTGITELDNSLAGMSGYSVAFTEPNGTLLRVSAQFWQNTSGCTATTFYQQNIIWNATSGNAIADVVSVASNPDTIHNALIGSSTKVFNTNVFLPSDGSTVTGISFNAQGVISLDPRMFAIVAGFPTLTPQAAYLYTIFFRSTLAGIRLIAEQFMAQDSANFVFSGLTLDNIADGIRNTPNTPAMIAGGYVATVDGSNPISPGSGAIYLNADRRGVIVTTTSGATIAPTQQQIRDAQALALSGGAVVAANSVDDKLNKIPTNPGYTGIG